MKKRMALILALAVVLVALVGIAFAVFGGGGNKLTVEKADGTIETISAKKLASISEKNGRTRASYSGCTANGTGKIIDMWRQDTLTTHIVLDNGVKLEVNRRSSAEKDPVENLYVGDVVRYEGMLFSIGYHDVGGHDCYAELLCGRKISLVSPANT